MARASRDRRENRQDEHRQEPRTARRERRIGLRRLLGWAVFLPLASRAPLYGRLFWELVRDERTPGGRKAMLAVALGYLVLGRDLVPDDVPVLGGLDDLVVMVLAVDLFFDGVPDEVLDEKLDYLGIDRRAFQEDIRSIRRFTPALAPAHRPPRPRPGVVRRGYAAVKRDRPESPVLDQQGGFDRVKVILTKDVPKLGKTGEMKTVADGYAQNYLIPQKLAVSASGGAYRAYQHDIASREDKRQRERADAEIAATRVASTTLTMGVKVGEGGKLYGSINTQDIAEALGRRGIVVDKHKIELDQPIKSLGTYKVAVKVYAGMTPEVTIIVEPKG